MFLKGGGESLTNLENKAEGENSSLDAPDEVQKDNTQEGDTQEDIEKTVEKDSTDEQAKTDSNNTVLDHFFHSEEGDILTPSSPFQGDGKENLEQTAREGESSSVTSDNDGDNTEEEGDEDPLPEDEDEIQKELKKARETLEGPITESETFEELGMVVKVKALSGTFPKGTTPEITLIQGIEKEKVEQQIIDDPDTDVTSDAEMITFDIKFIYTLSNGSGVEVQPKDNTVQVTFQYKENEELQQAETSPEQDIQIIHINDKDEDGKIVAEGEEKVETIDINEQKSAKVENGLVIDAESFSYYTIVVQRRELPTPQTWQYGDNYLTISIAKPTGADGPDGFTIMDRNLGATSAGTTCDLDSNISTCGYHYQRGYNYGFDPSLSPDGVKTATFATWNTAYNHNGYDGSDVNKKFILGTSTSKYDIWSDNTPTNHNGLWGGENDSQSNNRGLDDISTTASNRQGPCPSGWHVPSAGEWSKLFEYWCRSSNDCDMNNMYRADEEGLYYNYDDPDIGTNFASDLKLPFAGRRGRSDASLYGQGSRGLYWSSSPDSAGSNYARNLNLDSSNVNANSNYYRAYGYSVRCFKDSYVASPSTYTLTFDSQGGTEVASQTVLDGESRSEPVAPSKANYDFAGWYDENDNLFDFTAQPTASHTLHAKWVQCPTGTSYSLLVQACSKTTPTSSADGLVYYWTDENGKGVISIKDPDSDTILTILDKNEGASVAGTDYQSYGYHYQRGNNTPFEMTCTANNSCSNASNFQTDTYANSPAIYQNFWPGHPYTNSTFIQGNSDYWSGNLHYDVLWGGLGDVGTTTSVDTFWGGIKNGDTRQGPCASGYHVPSIGEWNALITYWYNTKNPSSKKSFTSLNSFSDTTFKTDFKLPLAGYRDYSDASLYNQGSYGLYWSSSPNSAGSNDARSLYLDSSNVDANYGDRRADGLSVRCFKDSYVAPSTYTLELDANGGTLLGADSEGKLIQKVSEGKKAQQPVAPTKEGVNFQGWVYANDEATAFDFSTQTVNSNIQLKAKWPTQYTITFDATTNGASSTSQTSIIRDEGTVVTLPACNETKSGYTCIGWNTTSGAHEGLTSITLNDNVTVYAIFSKTLSANFVLVDSSAATLNSPTSTCTYYNKESACALSAPTLTAKVGYTVDGWSSTNGGTTTTTTFVDGGIYYSVTHNSTALVATFNLNGASKQTNAGGTAVAQNVTRECYRYNGNSSCSITSPSITPANGFTALGYNSNASATSSTLAQNTSTNISANTTWNAITKSESPITITFNVNGNLGSNSSDSCYRYNGNSSCSITSPSITPANGFTATGWSTNADTHTNQWSVNTAKDVAASTTYFAQSYKSATATFNANNNQIDSTSKSCTRYNGESTCQITTPTISNSVTPIVVGYTTSATAVDSASIGSNSPLDIAGGETYYAHTKKNGYSVTLSYSNGNGVSSISPASQICNVATAYDGASQVGCSKSAPTVNCSNGYSNPTWDKILSTPVLNNTTYTATCTDSEKPVCSVTTQPTKTSISLVEGYNTGKVIFTCTDNVGIATNSLSSNSVEYDDTVVSLSNATVGGTETNKTFAFTYSTIAEGSTTFKLNAGAVRDSALNTNLETSASNSVTVDTTAPTAPTCTENACYKGSKTVTCTSVESPIRYTTDGSAPTCSSSTWTNQSFSATTTLKVAVCDEAGNLSDINTYTYTADNSAPSVPTMTAEPEYTQGLSNAVISSTVTDNGCNGNVQYQFCKSTTDSTTNCSDTNLSNWLDTTGTTFTNLTDGQKYYYFVRTKDGLGNTSEWSSSTSSTQDNSAPAIAFTNNVKQNPSKVDDVSVNWDDATVKKWKYSDTNSCPTTSSSYNKTDSDTMNQSDETNNGKYICLYAEDTLGNATQLPSAYPINIDITAPTGGAFNINDNAQYTNSTAVTLKTTCATDTGAGAVEVAYGNTTNPDNWTDCSSEIDWTLTSGDGEKTVYMKFKDGLGNESAEITDTIILDTTAPTLSANNAGEWKTSNITITLSVDDTNGIDYSKFSWVSLADCVSNGTEFDNADTVSYTNEGQSTLYLCARDNAGNTKTWTGIYKLDTVAPAVSFSSENGAVAKSHTVTVTVTDSTSKIGADQKIKYKWSESAECGTEGFTQLSLTPSEAGSTTATASISTSGLSDGSYYLCILGGTVSDIAGNTNSSNKTDGVFVIDNTPPVFSEKTEFSNGWYTGNQISTFTYTDTGAGIADGENTTSCTISTEGEDSACTIEHVNICDKLGNCNTESQTSDSIKLDKTAPTFKEKTEFANGWYNTNQESEFIYEDNISGISGSNKTTCIIDEEGEDAKCTVISTNICNNAGLCNTTNLTSNSIKLDKTNPTCEITGNPLSPIKEDITLTVNYKVETNQIDDGYSWDNSTYSSTKTHTVFTNGTYTAYVKDAAGNTGSCSITVSTIDKTNPTATVTSTNGLKQTTQTASLSCSDNEGIASYYRGIKSNPENSDFTAVETPSTSFSTDKTVNNNGTYYLFCKDTAGNISDSVSKTYYSYEVHNMLNAIAQAEGTYNSTNYPQASTETYIALSGTEIPFSNVYTAPTYSDPYQYVGYTTTDSGTPSHSDSIYLNGNSVYYFWFNRVNHALILQIDTGIENIHYKVNNASDYTMVSDTTEVSMKEGSNAYAYATASDGYELTGIFKDYDADNPKSWNTITAQQIFIPETDIITYSIDYELNGGELEAGKSNPDEYTVETPTFTLNNPVKDGYTFAGWTGTALSNSTETVTITEGLFGDREYTATYSINNYDYRVEYYYDGVLSGTATETTSAPFGSIISTYTDKVIDGYVLSGTVGLPLTITSTVENNVIKVYYKKSTSLSYTIKYEDTDHNMLSGDVVVENQTFGDVITVTPGAIEGYVTPSAKNVTITANSSANVVTFTYNKRTDLTYTIKYQNSVGTSISGDVVVENQTFGDEVTVVPGAIEGYNTPASTGFTIKVSNPDVVFVYTERSDLSYKIRYLDTNNHELSGDVIVNGQTFGNNVVVDAPEIPGYNTPVSTGFTIKVVNPDVVFIYTPKTDIEYTVTYKDKYGSGLLADKTVNTGVMNTDVTENAPSIEGYEVQTGSFTIRLKATNNHIDFVYNPKEYTIKFVDGSGVEITETYSREYLSDTSSIDYPNWTKDGYTIHWDKAVPEKMPLYGIVITATWTPNTNTQYLVYHKKEKLDGSYETVSVYTGYGTTDTKVTPTVNSYPGFNSPEPQEITISGNGNTTLTYQYSRKIITLTLNNDNGSQNTIITGKYESNVQKPTTNPSKTGYTFTAWSPVIPDTFPAISGTHTAQWNIVTYGITYHLNGGTQVNPKEIYTIESDSFTLVNPTRDNYIFAGWTGSNGDELQTTVTIAKGTTGPKEYFANWYEDFNHDGQNDATETKYEVKFVAGEHGTLGGTTIYSGILSGYTLNNVVGYVEPSKNPATDYMFSGWTPSLNVNAKITSNVVYTGIFAEDFNHNGVNDATEPHFTVTYTDGVDGQVVFVDQVTSNILSGLATPSFNGSTGRDNYIFAGWTPSVADKVTGDATYTASWYEDFNHDGQNDATETKIVVRFLPGEHGSLAGTTVYEVLSGLTLASAGYTTAPTVTPDSDYMFSGWNTEIDTVNPLTSNVDYTAIYGEDKNHDGQNDEFETKYTVTINYVYSRGGTATGSYTTGNQLSGFTYNVPSPTIENYHADKITVSGTITGNVNLTVTYSPNTDTNHNEIADEEETPYKVTVNYEYSRGGESSPSVSGMYLSGIVFNFVSPNIPNYTPNSGTISGTGIEADQTFTVIYRPNTDENNDGYADEEETHYTLTIHYINTHSGTVFTDYTASLVSGASYNVVSQTKNHYTVSPATVSGVMSNENVEVYVIYTPDNDTNNNGIADEEENITPSNSGSNSSGGGGRKFPNSNTHGVSDAENDTKDQQSINEENNKNQNNPVGNKDSELIITDKNTKNYSSEVIDAYKWAYANDITTINSLDKAKPDNAIIRGHMAKVVVNYAVNVLGKEMPKEIPSYCKWNDNVKDWESKEIKEYAEKACALGIMGINVKSFQPKKVVTRAEFGTILSRILRGDKYNETKASKQNPYYAKHLKALKENRIMTKIDNPLNRKELREWVWVMLKRTAEM